MAIRLLGLCSNMQTWTTKRGFCRRWKLLCHAVISPHYTLHCFVTALTCGKAGPSGMALKSMEKEILPRCWMPHVLTNGDKKSDCRPSNSLKTGTNKFQFMTIKLFTQDGIDLVAKMAAGVWGKEQGAHDAEVASLFCQHLTRYSLYSADLAFQAEDEDGLQSIAFAWLPGDTNDAASWLRSQLPNLEEEEQKTLLTNERYLTRTDAELQSKMVPNSAKLSFFISRKPGYGTPVLNALIERLRERGIEWLYLWTDCTCNWEYYPKHGFEQIGEGTVPEFSTDDEEYVYKMFRKKIK